MKSILISINPKWCELIASGKKTVEVRKTKPKLETPFKVYIYCSQEKRLLTMFKKGERIDDENFFEENVFVRQNTWIGGRLNPNGKVIGEFICNGIDEFTPSESGVQFKRFKALYDTCLSVKEIRAYLNGKVGYGWHISDLVIYDKPRELSEFEIECKGGCDIPYVYEPPCEKCGKNKLKHPPQSWCYVEEVQE